MNRFVIVTTTIDSESAAQKLALRIIEERLAACVQMFPVRSIYRWKRKVEQAGEYLLQAKTRKSLAGKLTKLIKNLHSYDMPEIVVVPIVGGFPRYLSWISEETGGDGGKKENSRS